MSEELEMKKIIFICLPLILMLTSCIMGAKFKTTFDEESKTSFYVPTLVDYSAYLYVSRDLLTNECNMRMKVKDIQDYKQADEMGLGTSFSHKEGKLYYYVKKDDVNALYITSKD